MPPIMFSDESQLREALRQEIRAAAPPRRTDIKGWITVALGILGVVAAATVFVFKTNASADLEHEQLRGKIELNHQMIETQDLRQIEILERLDTLQANQILIGERLRVRGLEGEGTQR